MITNSIIEEEISIDSVFIDFQHPQECDSDDTNDKSLAQEVLTWEEIDTPIIRCQRTHSKDELIPLTLGSMDTADTSVSWDIDLEPLPNEELFMSLATEHDAFGAIVKQSPPPSTEYPDFVETPVFIRGVRHSFQVIQLAELSLSEHSSMSFVDRLREIEEDDVLFRDMSFVALQGKVI